MTTEKWQLYSQTGVDGPEYGVRIRPGYVVVGFQLEDARQIVAWQNASIQPEGDILGRAKAQLAEGYTAINESVVRELIAEVGRLRSLTLDQQYMMDDLDKEIIAKDARIKELEADKRRLEARVEYCHDQTKLIELIEAAFLEQFAQGIQAPKEKAELMAREALEKIRSSEHISDSTKMIRAGGKDDKNNS